MKSIIAMLISVAIANFSFNYFTTDSKPTENKYESIATPITEEVSGEPIAEKIIVDIPVAAPLTEIKSVTVKRTKHKSAAILSSVNMSNQLTHQSLLNGEQTLLGENFSFQFDNYDLNIEDFNRMLYMADQLIFNPEYKISISGNADNSGAENYNELLSQKRAESIKNYFLEVGVLPEQIITSFNGSQNPIADNATIEGREANRRVEVLLYH